MATEDERNEEVYEEYLRLGGKSSYPRFLDDHSIFLDETLDIFVYGDTKKHNTQEDALDQVVIDSDMSEKEVARHLQAEDNTGGYT
jgi:hypothetical protein|tara:strand:- start:210 stop:467 length:258 start_codon:yes stop_codon:yes gene_type:complete